MLVKAALTMIPRPRPDFLPGVGVAQDVTVDRDHLAAYQRVCGFRVDDRLPATYPHVLGFEPAMELLTRSDFPFPVVGLVHIANRIEQLRPLTVADQLSISVHAADLREHPRGRQFDLITTAEVDGELAWRDVSTYLRISRSGQREAKPADEQQPSPHAIWRVGRDVGTAYAKVSGDHNPIHTSRLGARLFGFPRPIAHGMWSKARCLAALEGRLPDVLTVDVAFKAPILLPGRVGFAYHAGEFQLFDVKNGKPHLTGRISS